MTTFPLLKWLASRARQRDCTLVVMHSTAGSTLGGALSTLRLKGLSYHYLIEKSGKVTKCVPASRVAFHAGASEGPGGPNCNGYSVGVCFVNRNDGKDPITGLQIQSAVELVRELKAQLPLVWIANHHGIAPKRKTDPKGFNLESFAVAVGLKAWKRKDAVWRTF